MRSEEGKSPVFLAIVLLPFSFLATLVSVYVAIYGFELPFEIHMKTEISQGKTVSFDELTLYRATLLDSIKLLRNQIGTLKVDKDSFAVETGVWQDSLLNLQNDKSLIESEIQQLTNNLNKVKNQFEQEKQNRMNRLTKIFQSIEQEQIDSVYVAQLDDETLMDILALARAQQAAVILQKIEPKRAAKLTSQYINPRLQ